MVELPSLDHPPAADLTRNTLGVISILLLIASSLWILSPFLNALIWSAMIVISTWPLMLLLERWLWGRRSLAVLVLTLALLLILLLPLGLAVGALAGNAAEIAAWLKSVRSGTFLTPPDWISGFPIAGAKIAEYWRQLASERGEALAGSVLPYTGRVLQWLMGRLGDLGGLVLHFMLTIVISGILYVHGETAARGVLAFARRLAGDNGEKAVYLATGAIRGVATGVLATALVQTAVAGAGLMIASLPATPLLISAVLILCLAQLGPMLIMIPVVVWKFYSGDPLWGGILLAFALVSGTIDNVIRPFLIRRGADLPLLLIFVGVVGGMISAGIVGIFAGPAILAVTHTLLKEWVAEDRSTRAESLPSQSHAT